jgi:hypothetical protein
MSLASVHRRRRDLRLLVGDGICFSLMTGAGEWQFVLFALALGYSEVTSGLLATVPMFIGALVQLITPWGVRKIGSLRRWVWMFAAIQAVSLIPLVIGACVGSMPIWVLYIVISVYWASGYMTGPPWQTWFTSLVPQGIRSHFWTNRSRWIQGFLGIGLMAGLILQIGEQAGRPLIAFAVVFAIAALSRTVSAVLLSRHSEPNPGLAKQIEPPTPGTIRRLFADRRTRGLLLYMLAFFLCVFVTAPFFGPYMRETLGLEYWQIMCVQAGTFGSKILFLPLVGRLTKKFGPGKVLWLGAALTTPAAMFWLISDQLWWLVLLQVYVGFGWACWETGSFLLVFDTIPEEKRTPIMTVYQLALATMMTIGSLLGGGVLELMGTGLRGYAVLMILTSAMRLVSLFLLGSIEPSGLRLRHRARTLAIRTRGMIPGWPTIDVDVIEDGSSEPGRRDDRDEAE